MPIKERTIGDIATALINAKKHGMQSTVFLGAGCSVTAGIPLASGIVNRIKTGFPDRYEQAPEPKNYQNVMGEMDSGPRHELVAELVNDAKLNWAHIMLGLLVEQGYVGRILTTNFDNLAARALSLYGVFPAVYDLAASQDFTSDLVPVRSIFHLHGQADGFVQCHDKNEVNRQAHSTEVVFGDSSVRRPWIVIGYSGENDPMFTNLTNIKKFEYGLYWVGYKNNDPSAEVGTSLLDKDDAEKKKQAYLVRGYDADGFFIDLCRKLDLKIPSFIENPFLHMTKVIEGFTTFPTEKGHDFREEPLSWLKDGESCFIIGTDVCPKVERKQATRDNEKQARTLLFQGKYDEVISRRPTNEADWTVGLRDIVAGAYMGKGNTITDLAKTKFGEEADRLFLQAGEMYAEALRIKSDDHKALNNWGHALLDQTRTKSGEEAGKLLLKAREKFAKALMIKSDDHYAMNNWGIALSEQAKMSSGEEADRLFLQAGEKFAEALRIKPDKYEAINNWGLSLYEMAITKSGEEADRFILQACEKFNEALRINPDLHGAWNNLGIIFIYLAKTKTGEEADNLFLQATEKLVEALRINPDNPDALFNVACLHALQKKVVLCIDWLQKRQAVPPTLTKSMLDKDTDFDLVRTDPAFLAFRAGLPD